MNTKKENISKALKKLEYEFKENCNLDFYSNDSCSLGCGCNKKSWLAIVPKRLIFFPLIFLHIDNTKFLSPEANPHSKQE